jgi:GT2 family glycosyltransferase
VIGRIDADTIISKEWIARAEVLFDRSDVDAVSGVIGFYDTPFKPFADQLDRLLRAYLVRRLQTRHELLLQGSNMAIRRSAWQTVRLSLCDNASFHEDVDLAAHLAHQKYDVRFDPSLQVMVSARRIDSDMQSFRAYAWANSRTYAAHHLKGRFYMYPIQIFGVMLHLPLRFLYRMYNPVTHQISFKRALRHHADRRPASVIDVV